MKLNRREVLPLSMREASSGEKAGAGRVGSGSGR